MAKTGPTYVTKPKLLDTTVITLQNSPNVRISKLYRKLRYGTLKVYWINAHYKLLDINRDALYRSPLCHLTYSSYESYPYISAKDCFQRQQFKRHNYIYYYVGKKTSWNEALDYCKSKGGNLPVVRSREEYHGLLTLLKLPNTNIAFI